jgi:hypothetical protein
MFYYHYYVYYFFLLFIISIIIYFYYSSYSYYYFPSPSVLSVKHQIVNSETTDEVGYLSLFSLLLLSSFFVTGISCLITGREEEEEEGEREEELSEG